MTPSVNATIDRIDAWRRAHSLSFAEVARRSRLNEKTVVYVLKRRRPSCTIQTLAALEALVPADFVHLVTPPAAEEGEPGRECPEISNNAPKIWAMEA